MIEKANEFSNRRRKKMSEMTNEFSDRAVRAWEMLGDLKLFVKEVYSSEIIKDAQQEAFNKGYSAGFEEARTSGSEKEMEEFKKTWLTTKEQEWNAAYERGAEDMLMVIRRLFPVAPTGESYTWSELMNYFGSEKRHEIIMLDAMYLIDCDRKLEEARENTRSDSSPIEPGDEVASSDNATTFVVTHVSGNLLYGIGPTGGIYSNREIAKWHKTGKHYDLNKLLQMIGGGAK